MWCHSVQNGVVLSLKEVVMDYVTELELLCLHLLLLIREDERLPSSYTLC